MQFDVLTIFPEILSSYLKEGVLAHAIKKGIIQVNFHNLRDYAQDKHRTTDDKPFGGGPGMVMMIEPIYKAVKTVAGGRSNKQAQKKIILLSPKGKRFNQRKAKEYTKFKQLVLICGRYEGVDERVAKYLTDESISIGDYVLAGGELPAMVIVEAVARLVPGVLGNEMSLKLETHNSPYADFPQYTRPENFVTEEGKVWKVPPILLSGHHKKIADWRDKQRKER